MMKTTLRKIRAADPCGLRLEDAKCVSYLKLTPSACGRRRRMT